MAWVSLSRCSKPAKSRAGGDGGRAAGWAARWTVAVCAAAGDPCCSGADGWDPTTRVPAAGVPAAGVPATGVPAAGVPATGVPAADVAAVRAPPPCAVLGAASAVAGGGDAYGTEGGDSGGNAGGDSVACGSAAVAPAVVGVGGVEDSAGAGSSAVGRAGASATRDELPLKWVQALKPTRTSSPKPAIRAIGNFRGFDCIESNGSTPAERQVPVESRPLHAWTLEPLCANRGGSAHRRSNSRGALFLAGKVFLRYRRSRGIKRSVLPDFHIGAHAAVMRCPILTRDAGRYQTHYPTVAPITP